jgi:hypothetical protein
MFYVNVFDDVHLVTVCVDVVVFEIDFKCRRRVLEISVTTNATKTNAVCRHWNCEGELQLIRICESCVIVFG